MNGPRRRSPRQRDRRLDRQPVMTTPARSCELPVAGRRSLYNRPRASRRPRQGPSLVSTSAVNPPDDLPVVCAGLVVADHLVPADFVTCREPASSSRSTSWCSISAAAPPIRPSTSHGSACGRPCAPRWATIFSADSPRRRLKRTKWRPRSLMIDRELPTSQTLVVNVRGEDRRFIHCVGANAGFVAADLDARARACRRASCTSVIS